MAKLLGIDYGTKKVGIALSDTGATLAFPHVTLPNNEHLVAAIAEICGREGVTAVVVGESRDFSQKENPIMEDVRRLKDALWRATSLPVYLEPEFLTTAEARRSGGPREALDRSAAALILQSYLDRKKKSDATN